MSMLRQYFLDLFTGRTRATVCVWIHSRCSRSRPITNHLRLRTTSGAVTAKIWIIHKGGKRFEPERASLALCSKNGFIHANVVRSLDPDILCYPLFTGKVKTDHVHCLTKGVEEDTEVSRFHFPVTSRANNYIYSTRSRILFSSALETCVALLSDA
jgi:hypothetical protein